MKYAENNRISQRQLYRQIILTFLAPFLVCIPGMNSLTGLSGIVGVIIALLFLLLYVFFMMRTSYCYTDPVKMLGKLKGGLLGGFFLLYLIATAIYILTIIGQIVPVWAVSGISVRWLTFWAVVVCAYGVDRGMQRRGRMADVAGGLFLFVIIVMLVLCIGQGNVSYLKDMLNDSKVQGSAVWNGTYGFLCAFSGISLLPFVLHDVEKRGSAGKTVTAAVLTIGGILLAVLFLLPSVLGWKRMQNELYPILPLMAGADLPGNVLARFDVLWLGFLLYGLFFSLGSCFHYGNRILETVHFGSGKYWLPIIVYVVSFIQMNANEVTYLYKTYLGTIFVPGLILIQICLFFRGQQKRRKKAASVVSILLVLILGCTGCAGMEPEKRMYPLAMGIDAVDSEYIITYGMPDLPKATGQGKEEEEGNLSLTIRGSSFNEIEKQYERSQEKYLDIGHLQILVLSRNLIESDMWSGFLKYLKDEPLAGENIYVFQTEDPGELLNWKKGGTSLGEYVTGLMENRTDAKKKSGVTLRQVYQQWYQNGTLKTLPKITLKKMDESGEGEIQVWLE